MLQEIIQTELADNVKASEMLPDGTYRRKVNGGLPTDSQVVFMEKSLHNEENRMAVPKHRHQGGMAQRLRDLFSHR